MLKLTIFALLLIAAVQADDTWRDGHRDIRCPPNEGDLPKFFQGPDCTTFGFCNSGVLCECHKYQQ